MPSSRTPGPAARRSAAARERRGRAPLHGCGRERLPGPARQSAPRLTRLVDAARDNACQSPPPDDDARGGAGTSQCQSDSARCGQSIGTTRPRAHAAPGRRGGRAPESAEGAMDRRANLRAAHRDRRASRSTSVPRRGSEEPSSSSLLRGTTVARNLGTARAQLVERGVHDDAVEARSRTPPAPRSEPCSARPSASPPAPRPRRRHGSSSGAARPRTCADEPPPAAGRLSRLGLGDGSVERRSGDIPGGAAAGGATFRVGSVRTAPPG